MGGQKNEKYNRQTKYVVEETSCIEHLQWSCDLLSNIEDSNYCVY